MEVFEIVRGMINSKKKGFSLGPTFYLDTLQAFPF